MRNDGQTQLTDGARLTVVIAIISGGFLAAMSLGMQSLPLLLIATAVLVSTGLGVFAIRMRQNARRPVIGNATVMSASLPPVAAIVGRCDLRLLVSIPGQSQRMVKHRDPSVPLTRWPRVGTILPIEFTPRNPRQQVRILWDLVGLNPPSGGSGEDPAFAAQPFTDYAPTTYSPTTYSPTIYSPTPDAPAEYAATEYSPTDYPPDYPPGERRPSSPPEYVPDGPTEFVPGPDADPGATNARGLVHDGVLVDGGMLIDGDFFFDDAEFEFDADPPDELSREPLRPTAQLGSPSAPLTPPPALPKPSSRRPGSARPDSGRPDGGRPDSARPATPPWVTPPRGGASDVATVSESPDQTIEDPLPVRRSIPHPRSAPPQPPRDATEQAMGMMLFVSDLAISLRFYADLLSADVVDATPTSAVLSYAGSRILLRQMTDMAPVDRRVVHLHIQVPDLDAAYQELRENGLEFVHRPRVMNRGDKLDLWAATLRDPDGHAIALTQWRSREGPSATR